MGVGLGRKRPSPADDTGRTVEACRSRLGGQVNGASTFVQKTLVELQQGYGGSRSFLGIPRIMFILCSNTIRSRRHHILLPLDAQGQDLYQRSLILTTICPFSGVDGDDPALPGRTLESHRRPRQNNHPEAYVVAFFAVQQRTLLIACGVRALAGILGSVAVSMMSAAYGRHDAGERRPDRQSGGLPAPDFWDVPAWMCSESASSCCPEPPSSRLGQTPFFTPLGSVAKVGRKTLNCSWSAGTLPSRSSGGANTPVICEPVVSLANIDDGLLCR